MTTAASSRRILLVDNDHSFHRMLSDHLGPYGVEIVAASPGDPDVLTRVGAVSPELLIIAVDEPDKVGYSLCNKAKKGVAAKLPVILATSTVSPEGFANHRRLKIHADEYVDKRGLNPAEIVGKIDNLVGLGEIVAHADADLLDVPVEVEDVPMDLDGALVEEMEPINDFADEGGHTAIAPPRVVDAMIEADLDGAFAAITDFADEVSHGAAPAPAPAPPVAADEPKAAADYVENEPSMGIPEPIAHPHEPTPPPMAAPLGDELEAVEEPAADWHGEIPEAVDPVDLGDFDGEERTSADMPIAAMAKAAAVGVAAPAPVPVPAPVPAPEPVPPPPVADPGIDLGLDEVAARADAEQSGVHDRRTLQKVHNLERENAKLKADLEKAKAAAGDGKATGKEREFLHLREMIATKDKEILELRDELVVKDRQILDGKEKIRQFQHTKSQLEGKNLELEQRIVGDAEKVEIAETAKKELETQLADVTARLATVEAKAKTDVEVASKALAEKVAAAAALDKELTAVRARLAAAEDKHADVVAKHTDALARHKADAERAREDAVEALRGELAQAHATRTAALESEHAETLAAAKGEHAETLATKQREHEAAIAAVVADHEQRHEETRTAHAEALDSARRESAEALAAAKREHERALAAKQSEHETVIAEIQSIHEATLAGAKTAHDEAVAVARLAHERAVAEAQSRAQEEISSLVASHQSEKDRLAGAHARTVDELREKMSAEHGAAVAVLTQDRDAAQAETEKTRGELAAFAERAQRDLADARSEKQQVEAGLSTARDRIKALEGELAGARDTLAARDAAVAERDARIASQKHELDQLETENAGYQEQVLKAYQKIKQDEATVTRAKKAMAIALTLLDEEKDKKEQGA